MTTTFYDEIGGEETIRTIVHRFYEGVADDELLRPMYPEEDLGPAEERFTLFLMQYWGGPTTYGDTRGHPRLRMRHAPFQVTPDAAQRWLVHFRAGLDEADLTAGAGRAVLGLRDPRGAVHGQHDGVSGSADAASRNSVGHRRRPAGLAVDAHADHLRAGQHVVAVADDGLERRPTCCRCARPRSRQS